MVVRDQGGDGSRGSSHSLWRLATRLYADSRAVANGSRRIGAAALLSLAFYPYRHNRGRADYATGSLAGAACRGGHGHAHKRWTGARQSAIRSHGAQWTHRLLVTGRRPPMEGGDHEPIDTTPHCHHERYCNTADP